MKALLYIVCVFLFIPAGNAPEWELAKNSEGIKIYTRTDTAYAVKGVKAELEFEATLPQLVALVMDVNSYSQWVYQCTGSRLLKQVSKRELIYYHITDAPWPATDRDLVSRFVLNKVSDSVVELRSGQLDHFIPEKNEYVRVKRTQAHWVFTQLGTNRVRAEYTLLLDPGGSVPAWMLNFFVTEGPYQTFLNMRKKVKEPKYAAAVMTDFF